MEGFTVGRALDKHGWRSSDTAELVFQDVRVPVENVLGDAFDFVQVPRPDDGRTSGVCVRGFVAKYEGGHECGSLVRMTNLRAL